MSNPFCDFAVQRILHPEAETEPAIKPIAFSLHRFGFNAKAEAIGRNFDKEDVNLESHFAVDEDGTLYQFMPVNRQADAQAAGNAVAVSCETWDGGKDVPLNDAQVATIVRLLIWLNKEWGLSLAESTSAAGPGCGWHSKYTSWNPNKHACPGPTRIRQFTETILPRARAAAHKVAPRLKVVCVKAGSEESALLAHYPNLFGDRDLWIGVTQVDGATVDAVGFGVSVTNGRSYVGKDRYETLRLALAGEK